jgi:hypothetical protein
MANGLLLKLFVNKRPPQYFFQKVTITLYLGIQQPIFFESSTILPVPIKGLYHLIGKTN